VVGFSNSKLRKNRRYGKVNGPSCLSLQHCADFRPEKNNHRCEEYISSYLYFVQRDTFSFYVALITSVYC
jgi:hypothetical protein